ncbi:MAG: OmpH family outer membrane protein [Dongiaceae bacterium]
MTRIIVVSFVFLALSFGPLRSETASAQDQTPVVVGVVDFDNILVKSKAGQSVKAAISKLEGNFKAEIAKQEKAFREIEAKLKDEQGTLSEAELKKKLGDLQTQMQEANKKFREKEKALKVRSDKALKQINDTLVEVVRTIADERGMTLVLNQRYVVLAAPGFEVTAEALKRLDAKLPSVKM